MKKYWEKRKEFMRNVQRKIEKLEAQSELCEYWKEDPLSQESRESTGRKWETMIHNGPIFPPEYKPLPNRVGILYKGRPMKLSTTDFDNDFHISSEEAAVLYAKRTLQDKNQDKKRQEKNVGTKDLGFRENFWEDWKEILGNNSKIKNFNDVDFSQIVSYLERKTLEKQNKTRDEKTEMKERKRETKELYGYAIIDGIKTPIVSNIQPPSLFAGHGKSPNRGRIKGRILPSDIILNISEDSQPPYCEFYGKPCIWGGIVHNHNVEWIGKYRNPVTGNFVFMRPSRNSKFTCISDMNKFEKARYLGKHINILREKYKNDFYSEDGLIQQLAVAVYMLDKLSIRPGTEKGESDVVGLTTLQCSHINFLRGTKITLNFTGKSSIKFERTVKIDKIPYDIMKWICNQGSSMLFPNVNSTTLNSYLASIFPGEGITAKVFRTWKASSILQENLFENIPDPYSSPNLKKIIYNDVNIIVAHELNHRRMESNMIATDQINKKIRELKTQLINTTAPSKIKTLEERISTQEQKLNMAKLNIATTTSKTNYMDPRITVAWAKTGQVPIEKLFTKAQLSKFIWAMDTDKDWRF